LELLQKVKEKLQDIKHIGVKEITKLITKLKKFYKNNVIEVLMFIGAFFIAYATLQLNYIAFLYVVGFYFIGLAIFFIKYPKHQK
jgi:hypothetical protein